MADLSAVDWQQVGVGLGTAIAAAAAAAGAARRVWRKGLADLLRPVVTREVKRASHGLAEDLRTAVREAMEPVKEQIGDMRDDHEALAQDVEELKERMTKVEKAVALPLTARRDNPPS